MNKSSIFAFFLALIILTAIRSSSAANLIGQGTSGWIQFPSNDFSRIYDPGIEFTRSAQLALTAEGNEIAMSYTPASYELRKLPGKSSMRLQIFDAPYSPGEGSFDIGPNIDATMDLVFEGNGVWDVMCWDSDSGKYVTVASPVQNRISLPSNNCRFPSRAWSETLFIHSDDTPLIMRTVWKGASEPFRFSNKPANYRNLINVFRLQTRYGIARLAETGPGQIRSNDGNALNWMTHVNKSDFEQSLNWVVLYKTMQETFFSFEIDVSNIQDNYLFLFDKDADAHRLFSSKGKTESAKPPDEGIQMMVRWSDGSPLKYNKTSNILEGDIPITADPEWTWFDQTNRPNIRPDWQISGEMNQFDGPSWDTDKDPNGVDSVRWYRIPLHERKSDKIVVGWFGSNMPNNTFAFASSMPLAPAPCSQIGSCSEEFDTIPETLCDPVLDPGCIAPVPEEPFCDPSITPDCSVAGQNQISVERCYAFDFFGGDFQCSDQCLAVEPGTQITVRDTVRNVGANTARSVSYYPPPLSSAFVYDSYSVRIDDPEFGLTVGNDGNQFPGASGINIPGIIPPNDSREVFFQYFVPLDLLTNEPNEPATQCFPDSNDITQDIQNPDNYTDIVFEQNCSVSNQANDAVGNICVTVAPDPLLEVVLTALPSEESTVYQGSNILYFLTITNKTLQSVDEIVIEPAQPSQSLCVEGFCSGANIVQPPELSQKYGQLQLFTTIQVNDDASDGILRHSGVLIRFKGSSGLEQEIFSNSVQHFLKGSKESFGSFRHNIDLSRRIVLNASDRDTPRPDEADISIAEHSFSYSGTHTPYIWPEMYGFRNYRRNVCSPQFPSYENYDAQLNSGTYVFNSTQRRSRLSTFEQIRGDDAIFQITTKSPDKRPELLITNGKTPHLDQFEYRMSATDTGPKGLLSFMGNGGVITASELPKTIMRAVKDGTVGVVEATNQVISDSRDGYISRDLWVYAFYGIRYDQNRCIYCSYGGCWRYGARVNLYSWQLFRSDLIPLKATDTDSISVLGSVAWLQTKNGSLGFGTSAWGSTPKKGDPNLVILDDTSIATLMKVYTPPGESNADLFVSAPGQSDPLISGLGSKGRIDSQGFEEGFISSPLPDKRRQVSRGDVYDRPENPRDYFDDLINRQIYGNVIRLNGATSLPPGMTRQGNSFFVNGTLMLEPDTIYHMKGKLFLGRNPDQDVVLSGGKARLVVDGSSEIRSNIRYASSDASNLAMTPSVRLHTTGDIFVSPSVTDIELMMLAEGSFHSGKSDRQLRILGDVIALKTFWERSPLNQKRTQGDGINKPSELIIEDFRKYLIPPPGDKKLPDPGWFWKELIPGTNKGRYDWIRE